jgi:NAD(P)-dependent dehydrogenase (short-subunit alcohol dehydrogenase family)
VSRILFLHFTEAFYRSVPRHRKIRVNAIIPGMTDTPMVSSIVQSQEHGAQLQTILMKAVPLGGIGNPVKIEGRHFPRIR